MKLLDEVKVIQDNEEYRKCGVFADMIGTIIEADIRWNQFYVCFQDQKIYKSTYKKNENDIYSLRSDICCGIKIEDLQLIKDNNCSDEVIRESLPENHKDWWCKVENGYIINLKGDKKNKMPFKYNT